MDMPVDIPEKKECPKTACIQERRIEVEFIVNTMSAGRFAAQEIDASTGRAKYPTSMRNEYFSNLRRYQEELARIDAALE